MTTIQVILMPKLLSAFYRIMWFHHYWWIYIFYETICRSI